MPTKVGTQRDQAHRGRKSIRGSSSRSLGNQAGSAPVPFCCGSGRVDVLAVANGQRGPKQRKQRHLGAVSQRRRSPHGRVRKRNMLRQVYGNGRRARHAALGDPAPPGGACPSGMPAPALRSAGWDAQLSRALGSARYSRIPIARRLRLPPLRPGPAARVPNVREDGPPWRSGRRPGGSSERTSDDTEAMSCTGARARSSSRRPAPWPSTESATGRVETDGFPQGRLARPSNKMLVKRALSVD